MLIQILDCPELSIHHVLLLVYREICDGVRHEYGYIVNEINKIEDLRDEGLVLMGNNFNHLSRDCIINLLSKFNNAIFLGWFWKINMPEYSLIKKFIHIAGDKSNPYHDIELYNFYNSIDNYIPLTLLANEDPKLIGTYERKVERDYCYMGWQYSRELIPSPPFTGIYHGINDTSRYYDYPTRRNIYLSSTFALGFHSGEAITQGSISQRIFEGMCYGCIVLTTSRAASDYTDGIAIYIDSKNDLEEKMSYFLDNPDKLKEVQEKGYRWCKEKGTNRVLWKRIFNKINQLGFN